PDDQPRDALPLLVPENKPIHDAQSRLPKSSLESQPVAIENPESPQDLELLVCPAALVRVFGDLRVESLEARQRHEADRSIRVTPEIYALCPARLQAIDRNRGCSRIALNGCGPIAEKRSGRDADRA